MLEIKFKKKYNHKAEEICFVCAPVKNSNPSQDSIAFCLSHYLIGISLVGLTLQVLGISRFSPLKRHFTIILPFIMATVVYSICLYEDEFTTSQQIVPPTFKCICLISGIIACVLLVAILISLMFKINLCTILIVEILHLWYQKIYMYLHRTANEVYNAVEASSNKFHLLYHIQDWFHQKFQSIILTASRVFSSTRGSMEHGR